MSPFLWSLLLKFLIIFLLSLYIFLLFSNLCQYPSRFIFHFFELLRMKIIEHVVIFLFILSWLLRSNFYIYSSFFVLFLIASFILYFFFFYIYLYYFIFPFSVFNYLTSSCLNDIYSYNKFIRKFSFNLNLRTENSVHRMLICSIHQNVQEIQNKTWNFCCLILFIYKNTPKFTNFLIQNQSSIYQLIFFFFGISY